MIINAVVCVIGRHMSCVVFALAVGFSGVYPVHAAEPATAGIASLVIPGLGQATNDDYLTASAHFGLFAVSVYGAVRFSNRSDYLDPDDRYDEDNDREFINRTTLKYDYAARLATDTALYSSYGAYRDARQQNNSGYRTPVPRESLNDLAVAPFQFKFLSRPTTYIPLVIQALAVFSSGNEYRIDRQDDVSRRDLHTFNFVANELTAVGEEAMFRGFLNNEFSNRFGKTEGLISSSLIFGLAHSGQGQTATSVQATVAGLYLGWIHQQNGYEIGEGVALHYWINVLAGIAAIRNGGGSQLLSLRISY